MIALLLLVVAVPDRIHECIEKQDRQCLARELRSFNKAGSAAYLSAAAEAFLLLGRNNEAVAAIAGAVAKKPNDYDLLLQQGRTCQRTGDQVKAIESFLLAAKLQPRAAEIFYNLGLSFFLLHEYERAGKHFKHTVQLDAASDKAEFMLGVIDIMQQGNEASAKAHLERALALQPANPHYLLHYGVLLAQLNERDEADVILEKAVKADPSNPLAHFNLGRLAKQRNDLAKARTELEAAVRLRPELARAHYQLATVYRALKEPAKAAESVKLFQKYQEQDRDDEPIDGPPAYAFRDKPVQ
ncbi:MAG: tetratricopeptide repeat protein [Bryobacteraceae bacterium]